MYHKVWTCLEKTWCWNQRQHSVLSFLHPLQVTETRTGPLGCNSYDNLDSVSSVLLQSTESKLHLQGRTQEEGRGAIRARSGNAMREGWPFILLWSPSAVQVPYRIRAKLKIEEAADWAWAKKLGVPSYTKFWQISVDYAYSNTNKLHFFPLILMGHTAHISLCPSV